MTKIRRDRDDIDVTGDDKYLILVCKGDLLRVVHSKTGPEIGTRKETDLTKRNSIGEVSRDGGSTGISLYPKSEISTWVRRVRRRGKKEITRRIVTSGKLYKI